MVGGEIIIIHPSVLIKKCIHKLLLNEPAMKEDPFVEERNWTESENCKICKEDQKA